MGDILRIRAIKLSVCFFYASVAVCNAADNSYYSDAEDGYYWYKDPVKEKPVVPDKKKIRSDESPPKRKLPNMADYTYEQLWGLHPDDFNQLQEDFKKKAVMTLDPGDVTAYKTLQDIARRKAVAYMNVDQVVTQANPELSLENDVPYIPGARTADNRMAMADQDALLSSKRGSFGLIVFNRQNCPYCEEQKGILGYFQNYFGWDIKNVDITEQPGAATKFNVEITPTIILVKKGSSDYFPVSSGVIAMNQLKDRLYGGIKTLTGEQTIQQYGVKEYQKGGGLDPTAVYEKRKKGDKRAK